MMPEESSLLRVARVGTYQPPHQKSLISNIIMMDDGCRPSEEGCHLLACCFILLFEHEVKTTLSTDECFLKGTKSSNNGGNNDGSIYEPPSHVMVSINQQSRGCRHFSL
jgi:hypothetical protein